MNTGYLRERDLPSILVQIAAGPYPEYIDEVVATTARHRQRPTWTFPERWLPMDITRGARHAATWRLIMALALVAGLAITGVGVYVAARWVPDLVAPAPTGVLVVGTDDGDIVALDPRTGATRTIVGGPTYDRYPAFSADGQRFAFLRVGPPPDSMDEVFIANADGSGVRRLVEAGWVCCQTPAWSPLGDRFAVFAPEPWIIDADSGDITRLDVGLEILAADWHPDGRHLVIRAKGLLPADDRVGFYLVDVDSGEVSRIAFAPDAVDGPAMSPDGSTLAYASWSDGPGLQGRIHLLDIATGFERPMLFAGSKGSVELAPRFSPDGTSLLIERSTGSTGTYQLVIAPLDRPDPETQVGPIQPLGFGGSITDFSPDGSRIVAMYGNGGSTWLLDVSGGEGEPLPWTGIQGQTWQSVVP
jgi:dipeptidyl aminopeptidase/acylaminoacyl peptidase